MYQQIFLFCCFPAAQMPFGLVFFEDCAHCGIHCRIDLCELLCHIFVNRRFGYAETSGSLAHGSMCITDILTQGVATEDGKYPLEMEGRRKALLGDYLLVQVFRDVILDVVDGILNAGDPVHVDPSCRESV